MNKRDKIALGFLAHYLPVGVRAGRIVNKACPEKCDYVLFEGENVIFSAPKISAMKRFVFDNYAKAPR